MKIQGLERIQLVMPQGGEAKVKKEGHGHIKITATSIRY